MILHTARGPDDKRIQHALRSLRLLGWSEERARHEGGRLLGQRLGGVIRDIVKASPITRLLCSGGDTSSQVLKVLAPDGCRCRTLDSWDNVVSHRFQQAKASWARGGAQGGQMGNTDFFVKAKNGRP